MKRFLCTVLCVLVCAGILSGCGTTLEADTSTVYVDDKGTVLFIDVQELDQDYYDAAELEEYVDDLVEAHNAEYGKNSVKVESFSVEDQIVTLKMQYKTTDDFNNFNGIYNGIELYQGKVVDAIAAGYIFDADFVKVEDGEVTGAAAKQDIYAESDLRVVIIRANVDVKVDGEICYVSTENVNLTGLDSVSIREGYDLAGGSAETVIEISGSIEPEGTESVSEGMLSEDGTESAAEGTESVSASTVYDTETAEDAALSSAAEDGAFETDVYTYIIYK